MATEQFIQIIISLLIKQTKPFYYFLFHFIV